MIKIGLLIAASNVYFAFCDRMSMVALILLVIVLPPLISISIAALAAYASYSGLQ